MDPRMDASNSSNLQTPHLNQTQPLSSIITGGSISNNSNNFTSVPIRIVTQKSQLPVEFLEPSPENRLVIGLDCEGVDLSRDGTLCIMQLAFADAIYLVDAIEGGRTVMEACKPALESNYVTKVIHDCRKDSEALYFQFGIKLNNVMDTQIAYGIIEEQEGKRKGEVNDCVSFVGLLADPRYCGVSSHEKEEVRGLLRQDPSFWIRRPLSEIMIKSASGDVRFLLSIYEKMIHKLTKHSLWRVSVRGSLYCRCYCIDGNNDADWPPLPPIPDEIGAEESEMLSSINVPFGRTGSVIGRRGSFIRFVRQSSNATIFTDGYKGPAKKVYIIGRSEEVRKAEGFILRKLQEIY